MTLSPALLKDVNGCLDQALIFELSRDVDGGQPVLIPQGPPQPQSPSGGGAAIAAASRNSESCRFSRDTMLSNGRYSLQSREGLAPAGSSYRSSYLSERLPAQALRSGRHQSREISRGSMAVTLEEFEGLHNISNSTSKQNQSRDISRGGMAVTLDDFEGHRAPTSNDHSDSGSGILEHVCPEMVFKICYQTGALNCIRVSHSMCHKTCSSFLLPLILPVCFASLPSGVTARTIDPLQGPADCDARRSRLRDRISERL